MVPPMRPIVRAAGAGVVEPPETVPVLPDASDVTGPSLVFTEGTGDGALEGQTGPTSSKPVCTPPERSPPTRGSGVAAVHTGPAAEAG